MTDYQALPDPEAEQAIYEQMRSYDTDERLRYAQIGLMCLAVNQRGLFQHRQDPEDGLPCRSFARWLRIAAPWAYSTAYAALKDVEELSDVPAADLAQIPQSNMSTLKSLSTAVRRDPQVLALAKTRHTGELIAHIANNHPDQHVSQRKPIKIMVDDPEMVYSVLDQAIELHDAIDRGHALEMIAAMARRHWELESDVEQSLRMEAQ